MFSEKKRRKKGDEGNPPAVLNNMTVGIGRKKIDVENNGPNENNCRFDYPQALNNNGTCMKIREYVSGSDGNAPEFKYELSMNYIRNYHIIGKLYGCIHAEIKRKKHPVR